jgi:hypothetical protein
MRSVAHAHTSGLYHRIHRLLELDLDAGHHELLERLLVLAAPRAHGGDRHGQGVHVNGFCVVVTLDDLWRDE